MSNSILSNLNFHLFIVTSPLPALTDVQGHTWFKWKREVELGTISTTIATHSPHLAAERAWLAEQERPHKKDSIGNVVSQHYIQESPSKVGME